MWAIAPGYRCAHPGYKERLSCVEHPCILRPSALARIDDERSAFERDPGEPARHDADAVAAGKHKGPQIDMARRHALLDAGRAGRQRKRRLGDEVLRVRLE